MNLPLVLFAVLSLSAAEPTLPCSETSAPNWKDSIPGLDAARKDFLWAYLALPKGTPYGGGLGEDAWNESMDDAARCRTLRDYAVRLTKHEETKAGHLAFLKGKGRPAGKPLDYDLKAAVREMFMFRKWLDNFSGVSLAAAWRKEVDEALKDFKTDLTAAKDAKKKLAAPVPLGKAAVAGAAKVQADAAGAFDGSPVRSPGTHEPARLDPSGGVPPGPTVTELPEAVPTSAPAAPAGSEGPLGGNLPEAITAAGATAAGLGLVVGLGAGPVGVIAAASGLVAVVGVVLVGLGMGLRVTKTEVLSGKAGASAAPSDNSWPEVVQGVGMLTATGSAIAGFGAASVGVIGMVSGLGVVGGAALLGGGWLWRLYRTNFEKKSAPGPGPVSPR